MSAAPGGEPDAAGCCELRRVGETVGAERLGEARQSRTLELTGALAGDAELLPDCVQRRRLACEAEAELECPALPFGQPRERPADVLPLRRLGGQLGRI